jgi:hypothetical protein
MVKEKKHRRSMAFAFISMTKTKYRRENLTSKDFAIYRRFSSLQLRGKENPYYGKGYLSSGKNNPMYGKPCYYKMTEEEKQRWKNNISKGITGEKNPFYGKKHKPETIELLSKMNSIPIEVKFTDGSVVTFSQYKYLGTYLGKSPHLGNKLCKDQYSYLWKNYNIVSITKLKEGKFK